MKMAKLVGERFRERPSDCVIDSHALMVRGGYMKAVGSGIYTQTPPLRRIIRKIEEIIREEMEAIGGQEVLLPVVMPESLWQESGRAASVGSELLRFRDRHGSPHLLGMTHEEAAVQLVREYGSSYLRYPFMVYQIQTKFRDEARPRGGLIRVREFTMKDAYSFHLSPEDLADYYGQCYRAYERIFARVGLPQVIAIAADSGMMGGNVSHEFMLPTPVGEDTLALCPECGYKANMEAAENVVEPFAPVGEGSSGSGKLALVHTPGMHTIHEVCGFLGLREEQSCKAVVYRTEADGRLVILFIRGDLEVNETKLTNLLGGDVRPAVLEADGRLFAGFIGPVGLAEPGEGAAVLFDRSLQGAAGLCCGGNKPDHHYTGLDMERDCSGAEYHDLAKIKEGGICPACGKHTITLSRGIEVGNIFQLGDKYTRAMGMQAADQSGGLSYPLMGCYGIGIGRLAASVCEIHRDEHGPIWPISIAPWQVQLCCVRADDAAARACADELYRELQRLGIEVIYDDRTVSAGVMFSDADLLGVPVRVIVSPRNLQTGCCEIVARDKSVSMKIPVEEAAQAADDLVRRLLAELVWSE
ncbi:proline--tRNA ligase [Paenibacillus sp. YN15]|uniref:proline--tRNA ligase n=1 Tax=Paenibacillus sp. YN15 TaxID=1742774 RepID=UPI000DCF4DC1|nr:proline--tRNA ligase [Paenibacillus sp. YN15]RAU97110.1 proline--tRNA ligase [Paenibacillus sp. YN15]